MKKALLMASLLLLTSCTAARVALPKSAVAPGALETAESEAATAITHIGAYTTDPLSAYEGPEIGAILGDIASIQQEDNDVNFVAEAGTLKRDWDALLALDQLLQQEDAI